jgi:hypothetical protein
VQLAASQEGLSSMEFVSLMTWKEVTMASFKVLRYMMHRCIRVFISDRTKKCTLTLTVDISHIYRTVSSSNLEEW